jgi:hypothetical protein
MIAVKRSKQKNKNKHIPKLLTALANLNADRTCPNLHCNIWTLKLEVNAWALPRDA